VLHDMSVGQYDVVMDTGPGYNSKRQEAVDAMMPLIGGNEQLFQTIGDLVFRNMDFPGADIIADRLAANNPLAHIDDKSNVPPQVQMQLAVSQQQVQQLTQQLQAMQLMVKQRQDIEQVKQDNETKRELLKQTAKAHDIEMRDAERRHDVQMRTDTQAHDTIIKTQTQLQIEEMRAQLALMLADIDKRSEREALSNATDRAI